MAREINSGAASYCTTAQFLRHVDSELVGQLVRDDGGRDSEAELEDDEVLEEALRAASGEVESAATRGRLYTPEDLAALAADDGNGAAFLRSLVADFAVVLLRRRRGHVSQPLPQEERAMGLLDALARGERILPFSEVQGHGLPRTRFQSPSERAEVGYVADDPRFWGTHSGRHRRSQF